MPIKYTLGNHMSELKRTENSNREVGASLFELIVSLSVVTTLLLAMSAVTTRTISSLKLFERWHSDVLKISLLQSELSKLVQSYDSSRLADTLKIHKSGDIRIFDGDVHPISRIQSTSRPRSGSDAISSLALDMRGALSIDQNTTPQKACPLWNDGRYDSEAKSFLALTTEAAYQVKVTKIRSAMPKGCQIVRIDPLTSIFTKRVSSREEQVIALLLPIKAEYTLFIDATGQLRMIGHTGNQILENQPLGRGFRSLTIESSSIGVTPDLTLTLSLTAHLSLSKERRLSDSSRLTRKSPLELTVLRSTSTL